MLKKRGQKEYLEGLLDPYTQQELATIATALSPKVDHHDVEVIVGIARGYADQRMRPPNKIAKEFSERQMAASDAAKMAANALARLAKLCRTTNFLPLPLSTIDLVEKRLRDFHQSNKAKRAARAGVHKAGRKPPEHIIVAMAQLLRLWNNYRGDTKRGRRAFLAAALAPLGYDASENAFTDHINDAMALLGEPH